ncbi:type II toxin-antitoxin system RelE/ParE family toxin [Candidatus Saccharibacteria bacterium]|nr:type II toxin-antitoxin system RelE/ParE family toxin [Candidatus Saccharibacteria bacterium]
MKIIYTARAERDLLALGDYLLQNDFAMTPLIKIRDKIRMLKTMPQLGRKYDETARQITVLRKNVVYYEIQGDAIFILHISIGRQEKGL